MRIHMTNVFVDDLKKALDSCGDPIQIVSEG